MEKLYKQFVESVIEWKRNNKIDEFFIARLRLTFYYSITAIVILGSSSVLLYNTILSNLTRSIWNSVDNPHLAQIITDQAQDILLNRFLTINIIIILFITLIRALKVTRARTEK